MDGEWIKLRIALTHDPNVLRIAKSTGLDRFGVVGRLSDIWCWIGGHSSDGLAKIDAEMIDERVACPGFSAAMRAVGWLEGRDGELIFPRWERHNSNSAKARALEAEAKRLRRADHCPDIPAAPEPPKCPTNPAGNVRPEKRREELNTDSLSTHARPTLGQLTEQGRNAGVPPEVVQAFFDACESRPVSPDGQWTDKQGQPIAKELSALMGFWRHWQQNESQRKGGNHGHRKQSGTGSSFETTAGVGIKLL